MEKNLQKDIMDFFPYYQPKENKVSIDYFMTKVITEYLNKKYNNINAEKFEVVVKRHKNYFNFFLGKYKRISYLSIIFYR